MGQVLWSLSQGFKQSGWKMWPHGKNMALVPIERLSWHTVHTGVSYSWLPSFFLQWHCWMGTIGIFLITSFLVGFFFYWAFYPETSIIRVRMSSSKPPEDLKFYEKLVAKLWGLKLKKFPKGENSSYSNMLPKLNGLKKFPRNWSSFIILSPLKGSLKRWEFRWNGPCLTSGPNPKKNGEL